MWKVILTIFPHFWWAKGRTNGRTNGRMNQRIDQRMDRWMDGHSLLLRCVEMHLKMAQQNFAQHNFAHFSLFKKVWFAVWRDWSILLLKLCCMMKIHTVNENEWFIVIQKFLYLGASYWVSCVQKKVLVSLNSTTALHQPANPLLGPLPKKKYTADTLHKLFAVFVSARQKKDNGRTDGWRNRWRDTPSYRVVARNWK